MQGIVERPKGTRICTVQMKPERPVDLEPYDMKPMGLRVIPNPEGGDPSLADLVLNSCHVTPKQAWSGRGSISFGVESDLDPWHTLPVRRVTDALYVRSDMDVAPTAKVVKRFF
nr:acetoacetate decarboxylase family protein [Rhodococcus sp. CX]